MYTIKNVSLYGEITDISIDNGVIVSVGKTDADGTDMQGYRVYPGLFDTHTHGVVGHDTMDGDSLREMSENMLRNGTTSWLPTTMTMDMETIARATNEIPECENGAQIYGFHMEGPYINVKYKGAQNEAFIKAPDIKEFEALKNISMVTVAPELEGSMDFIKDCKAVVCLGHTDCDYDTAMEAIECGANGLTHTFNAMSPIHHRNPGPICAAAEKQIYVQAICDGVHLHKSIILMLYRLFGSDKMVLISDSIRATGLSDGKYDLGGQMMTVKNGEARTDTGALAGSTSYLYKCVRKAIEFGISDKEAFKMASETPFNMLGIKNGKIEEGYPADMLITDEKLNLIKVIKSGKIFDIK